MASPVAHISIDRFGRVVLPKGIRDRLGIREGTEFDVEEYEHSIVLKPIRKQAKLIRKGKALVVQLGEPITQDMINETIEKLRLERTEQILGMKIR